MTTSLTLYGIPNCDTVKKSRTWLAAHDVTHRFHDFKKDGVPPAQLQRWIQAVGWEKLLNRQGTTWRKLTPAEQAAIHDAKSAATLMLAQPSVIKRPVVEWTPVAEDVTVGFNADVWANQLAR
ncbi:ArsC family reductase [Ottowia thiooxydans]|uniref:ArsC family reductase n=1 Tax=Ottowia thiooxydans TaxID=219182 RepID=UPI0003F8CB62|nr:ArsC family reductase [Ottowia thiooxydans]